MSNYKMIAIDSDELDMIISEVTGKQMRINYGETEEVVLESIDVYRSMCDDENAERVLCKLAKCFDKNAKDCRLSYITCGDTKEVPENIIVFLLY